MNEGMMAKSPSRLKKIAGLHDPLHENSDNAAAQEHTDRTHLTHQTFMVNVIILSIVKELKNRQKRHSP
ncbi:hypothetical protein L4C36_22840 [Photobacterium japonica]|uniref:hypothetical protein n=1 Tax=Photobacterium japonica TaxID=2910235 RepID=UPI003D0C28A6